MDYYGNLDRPVGLVFANMTWGTEDRNITVNIGTGTKIENGLGEFSRTLSIPEYAWVRQYYYTYNISGTTKWVALAGEHQRNEPHFRKPLVHHRELLGAKSRYTTRITGAASSLRTCPSTTDSIPSPMDLPSSRWASAT